MDEIGVLIKFVVLTAMLFTIGCSHLSKKPVDYSTLEGRESFAGIVSDNLSDVRNCYLNKLDDDQDFECRMNFAVEIGKNGEALTAKLKDSTGCKANDSIIACVGSAIRSWRFSPSSSELPVVIEYPFDLRKTGSKFLR